MVVAWGLKKLMSRISGSGGAYNLLKNRVGMWGWQDNERILVVVQGQEAYIGRKDWGQQRSPQCIYMNKQWWCAPSWPHNIKCQHHGHITYIEVCLGETIKESHLAWCSLIPRSSTCERRFGWAYCVTMMGVNWCKYLGSRRSVWSVDCPCCTAIPLKMQQTSKCAMKTPPKPHHAMLCVLPNSCVLFGWNLVSYYFLIPLKPASSSRIYPKPHYGAKKMQ